MDMKLRKIIRDFVNWQGKNDMLKDELTIDYEVAETYLEQTNLTFCSSSLQLPSKQEMWTERGKQVVDIEENNTAFGKHTPFLLGFSLGFEKSYEWLTK